MICNQNTKALFLRICLIGILCVFKTFSALAGPGAVDTTFNVIANNPVYCTQVQPNGKILIGGAFTLVNNTSHYMFARLNPDGSIDTSITNVLSSGGTVYCMLIQTDGRFVLGGSFSANGHNNLVRLNPDGSIDNSFTNASSPSSPVYAVAEQTDGKILIGGQFTTMAGSNHYYIARVNTDGTVDNTFNPGTISGSIVDAIAIQNDGNILIGGSFGTFSTYGLSRTNIARLTTNGIPDLTYAPGANGQIEAIYLEPSGKAFYVGSFTTMNSTSRSRAARVNTDGSLDGGFTTPSGGANNIVYAVAEDVSGEIYQGGQFSAYNGSIHESVARTFSDGTLDNVFNTNNFSTPLVHALSIQGDGKVIVGGQFFVWGTLGRTNLVRLYGNTYPAEITTQPQSTNIIVGTNTTFSVDVSNPTTVSYQWYFNGTAIPGATDNEYSVFNAQLYDSGAYSVFVSSGVGGTSSSSANLVVGIPPAITQPPTNFSVVVGQTTGNSAAASGTPLNYYWYYNVKTLVGTNATLVLSNVVPSQAGLYTFVASNFLGAVSNSATLTVFYPISLNNGPQSQSVAVGGTATFNVSATGNPLNYQWLKNGNPITGANASQFQISNVAFTDAAGYSVIVSNQFNSQTSSVATLTVGYPPTITMQPTNMTANLGDTVSFTAAASGTGPLSYQWTLNSNAIAGQTSSNLTLTNVQINNIGNYALSVTSPFGSTISSNAFLNLNGYPSNLYYGLIAYYPFSGNANDATGNGNNGLVSNALLTQDRFGNPNKAYQFDGLTSSITCAISNIPNGAQPRTVSLWAKAAGISNGAENAIWWGAAQNTQGFGILDNGSPLTWQGQSFGGGDDVDSGILVDTNWHQVVVEYDGSQLSIAVDGTFYNSLSIPLSTAFSGVLIGNGASSTYFAGGIDEVRIYNHALGTNDIQQLYQLENTPPGAPAILQQPQSLSLVAGQTANFSVQASGTGNLSYQWYSSNSPAGSTTAALTIPSVQPGNTGTYYVVVTNSLGAVTSTVANLIVGTPPQNLKVHVASHMPVIQMQGTPKFNYVVQCATNFTPPVMWQNLAAIPAGTNGNWSFTDTNPPVNGARFYRVVAP